MTQAESTPTQEEVFAFLDDLRDTGSLNMYAAAPYLQATFGIPRHLARQWLSEWMHAYPSRRAKPLLETGKPHE